MCFCSKRNLNSQNGKVNEKEIAQLLSQQLSTFKDPNSVSVMSIENAVNDGKVNKNEI